MCFGRNISVLLSVDGHLGCVINSPFLCVNVSIDHYCTKCEKGFGKLFDLYLRWRKWLLLQHAHKAGSYPDSY